MYELHVKGFTRRHPGVPEPLRGTYAGLASPAAVEHLLILGVNAVELLPVHYRVSERFLVEQGLANYWGYNTLGSLAPDPRLAAADARVDFGLPPRLAALDQQVVLDTAGTDREARAVKDAYDLPAHSAAVLLVTRPAA